MKQILSCLLILCFLGWGCKEGESSSTNNNDSIAETTDKTLPPRRKGIDARTFFMKLPKDPNSEILYKDDSISRADILHRSEENQSRVFSYRDKDADANLFFRLYNRYDGEQFFVTVEQMGSSNSWIKVWKYNPDSETVSEHSNALPTVTAQMYVDDPTIIPDDYQPSFVYSFEDKDILIDLYTWMDPIFENHKVTKEVRIIWGSEGFEVQSQKLP